MTNEDVMMTLLENLPHTYKHLVTILKMMSMKKLSMVYMTAVLMHKISKRKENELKVMMLQWCCIKENEQFILPQRCEDMLLL